MDKTAKCVPSVTVTDICHWYFYVAVITYRSSLCKVPFAVNVASANKQEMATPPFWNALI